MRALETQLLSIATGASSTVDLPVVCREVACARLHNAARAMAKAVARQPPTAHTMRELERLYGILTLASPAAARPMLERLLMTLSSGCMALPESEELLEWQRLATAAQQALFATRISGTMDAWTVIGVVVEPLPDLLQPNHSNHWVNI